MFQIVSGILRLPRDPSVGLVVAQVRRSPKSVATDRGLIWRRHDCHGLCDAKCRDEGPLA
jgi:hypothetical protein